MLTEINGERYNVEAIQARLVDVQKNASYSELRALASLVGDLIRDLMAERSAHPTPAEQPK